MYWKRFDCLNIDINKAITIDTDWAPDFAIEYVVQQLVRYKIKATWFITHSSPFIEQLKEHDKLFELGIHPNFLPNSTQGNNPESVLSYCLKIVPNAVSMRTHALVQSTPLLSLVARSTPIRIDFIFFSS